MSTWKSGKQTQGRKWDLNADEKELLGLASTLVCEREVGLELKRGCDHPCHVHMGFQYPLTGAELRYDQSPQIGPGLNKVGCGFLVVHWRKREVDARWQEVSGGVTNSYRSVNLIFWRNSAVKCISSSRMLPGSLLFPRVRTSCMHQLQILGQHTPRCPDH